MKKTEFKRSLYVKPQTNVIKMDDEQFICTTVITNVPGSTEDDWDNDEDVDGGEWEI